MPCSNIGSAFQPFSWFVSRNHSRLSVSPFRLFIMFITEASVRAIVAVRSLVDLCPIHLVCRLLHHCRAVANISHRTSIFISANTLTLHFSLTQVVLVQFTMDAQDASARRCEKCDEFKPPRAHHCSTLFHCFHFCVQRSRGVFTDRDGASAALQASAIDAFCEWIITAFGWEHVLGSITTNLSSSC